MIPTPINLIAQREDLNYMRDWQYLALQPPNILAVVSNNASDVFVCKCSKGFFFFLCCM